MSSMLDTDKIGEAIAWAITQNEAAKYSYSMPPLTVGEINAMSMLDSNLYSHLNNNNLRVDRLLGPGRWYIVSMSNSMETAVLDIPWLQTSARVARQDWPLWAAMRGSPNVYDRLLAAVGSFFLEHT